MSIAELPAIQRLNPEGNGLLMTPAEFDAVDDWDRDYVFELVQGVVIVSPAPGPAERLPNDLLGYGVRPGDADKVRRIGNRPLTAAAGLRTLHRATEESHRSLSGTRSVLSFQFIQLPTL
ncbi:MAG: hypothetical protein KF861_06065 [Planctomycetaceae bacterium]|nr:hypothetical protein [Planctomycetaceae bacterium]